MGNGGSDGDKGIVSVTLSGQVWNLELHWRDKYVLLALADSVNEKKGDGICWPSVATLRKRTCLSERSIQRSIRQLCRHGYISMQERYGRSHKFTITPGTRSPPSESHLVMVTPSPPSTSRQ